MDLPFYQEFFQSVDALWGQQLFGVFHWGDGVIFITIFISELGVPIFHIPNEAILIFGGSQFGSTIGLDELRFMASAIAADILGAALFFFIFRFWGYWILERFGPRFGLTRQKLQRFYDYFAKNGLWTVFVGRTIPYARIYTSMAAGIFQVRPFTFIASVIPSSVIWVTTFSFVGFALRKKWQDGVAFLETHRLTTLLIFIILVLIILILYLRRRNGNGIAQTAVIHQHPPSTKTLPRPDGTVLSYIYQPGAKDRPTIVFIHGVAGNHTCWYDIAPYFSNLGYGVLLPDLRGHGLSSKIQKRRLYHLPQFVDDTEEIINNERLTKVILVGYSIGGAIATIIAERRPELVDKIILISSAHQSPFVYYGISFLLPVAQLMLDAAAIILHWYRRRRYAFFSQLEIKPIWKSTLETLKTIPLDINLWAIRTAISVSFPETLKKLRLPTLIMRGYHDHLYTLREAEDMAALLPRGELKIISEANHFLPTHHPQKIIADLKEFITRE